MLGNQDFEIAYEMSELRYLIVKADRLSRSDAYAEICFAEQLLIGHKPSDPALTFEMLAKSVGIELVHVRPLSNNESMPLGQTSPLSKSKIFKAC